MNTFTALFLVSTCVRVNYYIDEYAHRDSVAGILLVSFCGLFEMKDVTGVIDAHTHIFPPYQIKNRKKLLEIDKGFAELYSDPKARLADADQLLEIIEDDFFSGAVAAGFAFSEESVARAQNEYLLEVAKENPSIIPFVNINLRWDNWVLEAERLLNLGARGFGELRPGTQNWNPLDVEAKRIYELANDANVPLLWHSSEPFRHVYPGKMGGIAPDSLLMCATEYPEVIMIGAPLGAGAPFFLQMPEIRRSLPNLLFDTAAAPLLYGDRCVARLVDLVGVDRVLFASDFPLRNPIKDFELAVEDLSEKDAYAIGALNARRVLLTND